ncbi:protein kinase [Myxococcota bacterium]|nr:protein kinase [Myxococcota bacterium]
MTGNDPPSSPPSSVGPGSGEPHAGTGTLIYGGIETAGTIDASRIPDATAGVPDATAGVPAPDPVPPQLDPRYVVQRELGRGGMGRVLLVFDDRIKRSVALKEMLTAEMAESGRKSGASSRMNRFLREVRLSGHLEHPSIVPVYDMGESGDQAFYTMRYLQGASFAAALKACSTLDQRLLTLPNFRDVCNAIAFAHSKNVIHRDLKPDNVILGDFGETMVVDWGLAKMQGDSHEVDLRLAEEIRHLQEDDDAGKTQFGTTIGTPAYMAPEQAMGQLDRIDHQSDIYSLGAMLYELLTGAPPFAGGAVAKVLLRVVTEAPRPVRELVPEAPAELCAIAEKALQKDKQDRYATCSEMTRDLTAYLSGEKVGSYQYSSWELVRRFVRRNRVLVAAAALVLLALAGTAAFMTRAWRQESRAHAVARTARDRESRALAQEQAARQVSETQKRNAQTALQQKLVEERAAKYRLADAHLARAAHLFQEKFFLEAMVYAASAALHHPGNPKSPYHHPGFCDGDADCATLTARAHGFFVMARNSSYFAFDRAIHEDDPMKLALGLPLRPQLHASPDGRFVMASVREKRIRIRDLATGLVARDLNDLPEPAQQVSFDASGRLVVSIDSAGQLRIWDFATGAVVRQAQTELKNTFWLDYRTGSDDVVAATPDGKLARIDVQKGSVTALGPGRPLRIKNVVMDPAGARLAVTEAEGAVHLLDFARGSWSLLDTGGQVPGTGAFSGSGKRLVLPTPAANAVSVYEAPDWKPILRRNMIHAGGGFFLNQVLGMDFPAESFLGRSPFYRFQLVDADLGALQNFHFWGPLSLAGRARNALLILSSPTDILVYRANPAALSSRHSRAEGMVGLIRTLSVRHTVTGTWSGTVRLFDAADGTTRLLGTPALGYVWSAALSPDERLLVTGARDNSIQAFSLPDGAVRGRRLLDAPVTYLQFSVDGKKLHVGTLTHMLVLDPTTLATVSQVPSARVFSNGPAVDASASKILWKIPGGDEAEPVFAIHDLESGKRSELRLPGEKPGSVTPVLLEGDAVVFQGRDHCLGLIQLPEPRVRQRYCGFHQTMATVAISRRRNLLLASGDDQTVRLWALDTGRPLLVLPTISGQVATFDFDQTHILFEFGIQVLRLPLDFSFADLSAADLMKLAKATSGLCLDGTRLRPAPECTKTPVR